MTRRKMGVALYGAKAGDRVHIVSEDGTELHLSIGDVPSGASVFGAAAFPKPMPALSDRGQARIVGGDDPNAGDVIDVEPAEALPPERRLGPGYRHVDGAQAHRPAVAPDPIRNVKASLAIAVLGGGFAIAGLVIIWAWVLAGAIALGFGGTIAAWGLDRIRKAVRSIS